MRTKPENAALRTAILEIISTQGSVRRGVIDDLLELGEGQTRKTVDNTLQRLKMAGKIVYSMDGSWRMAGTPAPDLTAAAASRPAARPKAAVPKPVVTRSAFAELVPESTVVMSRAHPSPLPGLVMAAAGTITVEISLQLTQADVLELAERMPAVMQAVGALVALQVELAERRSNP